MHVEGGQSASYVSGQWPIYRAPIHKELTMKQSILMEKYPVFELDLHKNETSCNSVDEIIEKLKSKIDAHPKIAYIGVFDHFDHTKSIGGEINENMSDAKNLLFCFGFALPNPRVLSVRPRSIGISDMGDHFAIIFMEPPMELATNEMEAWCKDLADK